MAAQISENALPGARHHPANAFIKLSHN